ncbi:glycosyltransferase [Mangrovimonas sp. DI 80]|nr:glycosyltransferase [Mangrovimonas sp. DI 80]
MNTDLIPQKIKDLKVCVLMPTYNNHRTLQRVIDGVLQYTGEVLIVNDGSTDSTRTILQSYTNIQCLHFTENKGKGVALREGFKKAAQLGYDYTITIDSDGQHFPSDIPVFLEALEEHPTGELLLIGARNMSQEGVPSKSSFGNKFSNFWFWFETGIKLDDTQSGFRLYPLKHLKALNFYTTKFEFEIEVIVKAAWRDVEVKNVPIQVLYDESERVSHFRPFKDFTRISILNTWLVFLTIFYIKPREVYRKLKKKGIKRFFVEDFLGSYDSPSKKALSIALGVFIGLSPFWGFHTVLVIFLAIFLKLNKAIAFAFSNVSLPPFIPFVLYASSKIGQYLLGVEFSYSMDEVTSNFGVIKHLEAYLVGSFALAALMSSVFGILGFLFFSIVDKKKVILKNG